MSPRRRNALSLDNEPQDVASMVNHTLNAITTFDEDTHAHPTVPYENARDEVEKVLTAPGEKPTPFTETLSHVIAAGTQASNTSGARSFQHVPGSSLPSSALGELLTQVFNRHSGYANHAPILAAMEQGVIRWSVSEFGLPHSTGGLLTSGGSLSTLTALATARHDRFPDDWSDARIYLTRYTHGSFAKAARITGFPPRQLHFVETDRDGHMDPEALQRAIIEDLQAGLTPFLVVGTAGTTDLGTVDPLDALASISQEHKLWFHIDAAYGGFFQLTERGRRALTGIEKADSLILDAHKSLFLPFGTGVVLLRNEALLEKLYTVEGPYLNDHRSEYPLPNRADRGPELTTESRGVRVWLPLHTHGVAAFRSTLDEKLDLAAAAYDALKADSRLSVRKPELSTVVFAVRAGDEATATMMERVNASEAGTVSGSIVDGQLVIRICILNYRTHSEHVDGLVKEILATLDGLDCSQERTG